MPPFRFESYVDMGGLFQRLAKRKHIRSDCGRQRRPDTKNRTPDAMTYEHYNRNVASARKGGRTNAEIRTEVSDPGPPIGRARALQGLWSCRQAPGTAPRGFHRRGDGRRGTC